LVATYDYHDAAGRLTYQSIRYAAPKDFRQRRPDGKGGWIWNMDGVVRIPFNLPALVRSNVALIAEGEKDALNLQKASAGFPDNDGKLSYAATCNVGGAGKWLDEYSLYLAGKKAFVFQDNDDPGRKHAQQVCASIHKYAQAVHLVELPGLAEHGDVSDYLAVQSPSELFSLMQAAPVWTPPVAPSIPPMAPQSGFRLVGLGDLLSRPEKDVDYLVDGMLVLGTVSCLVAKPKVGKSTLARGLCLAVAKGTDFLGRTVRQGDCIYLALEERPEDITSDFRAMGADGTEPISVHADAAPEAALLSLVSLVQKQQPALVVIDPLFRMVRVRDEKAYAEVYAALGPLIDAARTTGTHILLTHHSGKALKGDAIDSPLGSTALGGAVSALMVMKRTESYRSIQTVQRIGLDMPETVLSFDPETRQLSVSGTRADADRHEVEKEIIEYLKVGGEKTETEISEHVEGANAIKRKALRSLVDRGMVGRDGTGKKGEPYKYSFACTEPIPRTSVQESQKSHQALINTDQMLVRGNNTGGKEVFLDVEV
jgi:hypothetical protein